VTVGTVLQGTRIPLPDWVKVMKVFHVNNGNIKAADVCPLIGVTPKSARRMIKVLTDAVESDQFWNPKKLVAKKNGRPLRKASDKLILTAYRGRNDIVFRNILRLYVPEGSSVADVTYGLGKFWTLVDKSKYTVVATDIQTGTDFRDLPYEDESVDALVLDPPYMHYSAGTAYKNHTDFADRYKVNTKHHDEIKGHDAVLALYYEGAEEARRVLKRRGILIIKAMDEYAERQRLTHVELINHLTRHGYVVEDLFVVMRVDTPTLSSPTIQRHARKNHSYFIIFRKKRAKGK
jgi:hypothetical protein